MKKTKLIIALALMLGTLQLANAQDGKFRFGVKGGVNFSNLYTDNVDDEHVLVGFNAGLFAKLPITKFLAIQPEIYFTTKGSELVYNNTFVTGTAKFNLNYVEVPVLVVVNLGKHFNVHFGPYVGYLLDGSITNDSNLNVFDFENSINEDDFNKLDAGIALGLGMDVDALSFGVRYNYGLTTVGELQDYNGTQYTFPDGKNSVINVYVGIALN
jgi:hypothetical protein